jgi:hypothetical protein
LCRIGSDFEERLDRSKLDFRWEMLQRIGATIEGIGRAIAKGMSQRSRSEKEATERIHEVAELLGRLDGVKTSLMKLRENLGAISRC